MSKNRPSVAPPFQSARRRRRGISAIGISACATTPPSKGRAVVIGGGFGGATAARYIRTLDPAIEVTMVEPSQTFYTCPFSNYVLAGFKKMDDIAHNYATLRTKHGVQVRARHRHGDRCTAKTVRLAGGITLPYDRLVVSPGIDIRWNALEGYNEAAAEQMPHAWKAGPADDACCGASSRRCRTAGCVILAPPANPFRCPPGPYERTAMIAHYLKTSEAALEDPGARREGPVLQAGPVHGGLEGGLWRHDRVGAAVEGRQGGARRSPAR